MYDQSSLLIASVLFISMLCVNQICFFLGRRFETDDEHAEVKSQATAIQAGIVGLLALLLGFTFNMSLQRYDDRSSIVIEEASAISKAAMQAKLISNQNQSEALSLLDTYTQFRIEMSAVNLADTTQRRLQQKRVNDLQSQLFLFAQKEFAVSTKPAIANGFIQQITNIVTTENKRTAVLRLHVPEPVLFVLFLIFVTAGGVLGYTSGLYRKRPVFPTTVMSGLVVLVVFIVIDLDRPRRGVIQVDQESLSDTQAQIQDYLTALIEK